MSRACGTLEILSGGTTVRVPVDRIYFAFESGRFDYDCISCGGKCCSGHGYELRVGDELRAHVATSAAVRFFLDRCEAEAESHYHVKNCAPGCFFLTDTKMCGIQQAHGFAAKPETCRLFPFNNFLRVGEYFVVAPHTWLCPLHVLPPGQPSERSGHDALAEAMCAMPINLDIPNGEPTAGSPRELIELERRIVALTAPYCESGDYLGFAAAQLSATREVFHGTGPDVEADEPRAVLQRYRAAMYDVLGEAVPDDHETDRSLVRVLVAATPALRAQIVFRRVGPTTAKPWSVPVERVPHLLLALYAMARFARDAGMAQVTYQTVLRLCSDHQALLSMLTEIDRVLVWDAGATIDLSLNADAATKGRYAEVVRALLPQVQQQRPRVLAEILTATAHPAVEHALFLRQVAKRLAGRMVPIEKYRERSLVGKLGSPRSALQQWVVRAVGVERLMSLVDQSRRAASPAAQSEVSN